MATRSAEEFLSGVSGPAPAGGSTQSAEDFLAGVSSPLDAASTTAGSGTSVSSAPPQDTGLSRYVLGGLGTLVKGADIGLGQLGDLGTAANKYLMHPLDRALRSTGMVSSGAFAGNEPGKSLAAPDAQMLTTSDLLDLTGRAGITDQTSRIPGWGSHPGAERVGAAILQGTGTAVPMLALGGNPLTTLATGAAAGGAAGGVHELAPNMPGLETVAGLAAGGVAGGVESMLANKTIKGLAKSLGQSETVQQAGTEAQAAARDWIANVAPAKHAAAWAPFDAAVPASTPVPIDGLLQTLNKLSTKGGTLQPAIDALSPTLPKRLLDIIQNKSLVGVGVTPTLSEVQQLRTAIGDAMSNPQIVKDTTRQQLDAMYAATSGDIKSVATANNAGDLFDAANAESKRLFDFQEKTLGKVVKGDKPSSSDPNPEDVGRKLLSAGKSGGSDLAALRSEVPTAADELAAAHLMQTPLGWTKLSPEAREALVPDQGTRSKIDTAVAKIMPSSGSSLTHSAQALTGYFGGLGLDKLASHLLGDHAGGLLSASLELGGLALPTIGRGVKAAWTNPSLLRLPLVGASAGAGNDLYPAPNQR